MPPIAPIVGNLLPLGKKSAARVEHKIAAKPVFAPNAGARFQKALPQKCPTNGGLVEKRILLFA
ncbi:hypothetical protein ADN01_14635 [Levilinea saccharolytica]|uniref:Uncharacterized protein n=1 Tax=Levilinea saccharolytica TaxID=229921 RepID=A0A0P6XP96_9CHLR|nr:hypothetical protein ADN01_14635 [Levilinea saccharolytica]